MNLRTYGFVIAACCVLMSAAEASASALRSIVPLEMRSGAHTRIEVRRGDSGIVETGATAVVRARQRDSGVLSDIGRYQNKNDSGGTSIVDIDYTALMSGDYEVFVQSGTELSPSFVVRIERSVSRASSTHLACGHFCCDDCCDDFCDDGCDPCCDECGIAPSEAVVIVATVLVVDAALEAASEGCSLVSSGGCSARSLAVWMCCLFLSARFRTRFRFIAR